MATTKKTTVSKNTVTNTKSATTKRTTTKRTIPVTDENETKVMCPVCGTEFAIGEHEHAVKGIAIGKDSGLGEVFLPVSKRGKLLQAAGVDTSKYFSINLPGGGEQLMKMNDEGVPVAVTADDPVLAAIAKQGTVPNRNLFRRWVMSQVFHGLQNKYGGFTKWLAWKGYRYQWDMLLEELRVQKKLYGKDMENFEARNRWFNRELAVKMGKDYIEQLRHDANCRPIHKCKGVPYIKYDHENIFVSDIEKKLIAPIVERVEHISRQNAPTGLYFAVEQFCRAAHLNVTGGFKQCAEWKDAYKGMGAYATMQNLIRFHGCTFPKDNDFYTRKLSGLQMLENAALSYHNGEGWRLFGLMKQMLEENNIDIEAKMKGWSEAKKAKNLRR